VVPGEADDDGVQAAIAGELRLLEPSVRRAPEEVSALLHPDFVEFASTGRRWDRHQIIERLAAEHASGTVRIVTCGLAGVCLGAGIVHVTYISQQGERRCHRSSIWCKTADGWRMYFHQGTLIPPG
jgi:hypothetical protein